MSFIYPVEQGKVYAPGYFLAHEECERKTYQMAQAGATTAADGSKYIPMGTLYSETVEGTTNYIGFVYEDRLPATLTSAQKTALVAKGFTFVTDTEVTRPDFS